MIKVSSLNNNNYPKVQIIKMIINVLKNFIRMNFL